MLPADLPACPCIERFFACNSYATRFNIGSWRKRARSGKVREGPAPSLKAIDPPRGLAEIKRRVFERINEDRRRHGLASVQWDELAAQAGDAHCREMLEHGYLSQSNICEKGGGK